MNREMISVAKQFSRTPAGRYLSDGPKSGELFREKLLLPALRKNRHVVVDLTGAVGFGSSFLDEAFAGLIRAGLSLEELQKNLEVRSEVKTYISRIWQYINDEARRQTAALH